jgi:hypothetical protein
MKPLRYIKYLFVFFAILFISCEDTVLEQGFTLGREASFQVNQLYTSADGFYTLKITEVGDSRCAEGVVCVWSGEVTVKGELTERGQKQTFEIHSIVNQQNVQPEGFAVQIVDVKPYPKYGVETKPEDIIVTLLFKK